VKAGSQHAQPLLSRPWPARMTVLVLAPHPDDFDAIGVSLHQLQEQGHELHLAVLTGGASGVDDGFDGAQDTAAKTALREAEQRASCTFFGLPAARCRFLRLWHHPADAAQDAERLRTHVLALQPQLVFMPHGNDSNSTHRRTCQSLIELAAHERLTLWACLNQDAKTLQMRSDLYTAFDPALADWKARLLRHHRSQQQRNLRTRGSGFDGRVLQLNRDAATALGLDLPFAEVFELLHVVDGVARCG
jgi:LmbE family N-acetylglucosaminyl deacetylase